MQNRSNNGRRRNNNSRNDFRRRLAFESLEDRRMLNGDNLIANGNFESGNTGFSSQYFATGGRVSERQYRILTNPALGHAAAASYGDHTTGAGFMMMANGALTHNVTVWSQTVPVLPNTNYAFSAWASSWVGNSPADFEVAINGTSLGVFTAPAAAAVWEEFGATWNSGTSTSATLRIADLNIVKGGNDFALDDISLVAQNEVGIALAGDSEDVGVFLNTLNFYSEGVEYSADQGILTSTTTGQVVNHFATQLNSLIDRVSSEALTVTIQIGRDVPGVDALDLYEGNGLQLFDLNDLRHFPLVDDAVMTQDGVIMHAIAEAVAGAATAGLNYEIAHAEAIRAENDVYIHASPTHLLRGAFSKCVPRSCTAPPGGTLELWINMFSDSPTARGTSGWTVITIRNLENDDLQLADIRSGVIDTGVPWSGKITATAIESVLQLQTAEIDVKPGGDQNAVNLRSNGVLPVGGLVDL